MTRTTNMTMASMIRPFQLLVTCFNSLIGYISYFSPLRVTCQQL